MGRGGSDTPVLAASLPRSLNRKDTENSQAGASDLARQENKITERVGEGGGSLAFPKRKGRKWKMVFGEGGLCSDAQDG